MSAIFLPLLVGILTVLVVVQWFMIIGLNQRFNRQTKMLRQFFSGPQGEDLEALLERTLSESRQALENSKVALAKAEEVVAGLSGCVQHFSLLRYDAFDDVTGQQSFSLAMLDGRDNGAIVTAIFGRSNSRCFGKMIIDGQPEQALTEEEKKVLLQALEQKIAQPKLPKAGNHKVVFKTTTKPTTDETPTAKEEPALLAA